MSINLTAYDTLATKGYMLDKTRMALEDAYIRGMLRSSPDDPRVLLVDGGNPAQERIPAFAHPFFINPRKEESGYIAIDVRYFGKTSPVEPFKVRNLPEYTLTHNRGILNRIWIDEAPSILQNVSPIPMTVYASWISQAIARRFALDPQEQISLQILAAYFYSCQFIDDADMSEQMKLKLAGTIARVTRNSASTVMNVIESMPVITDVAQFCELAREATKSIRLDSLNPGILFLSLKGTWFGVNKDEIIPVAIEHPPTWLAVLTASFMDRSFRNTAITKIAETNAGKGAGELYLRAINNMVTSINS